MGYESTTIAIWGVLLKDSEKLKKLDRLMKDLGDSADEKDVWDANYENRFPIYLSDEVSVTEEEYSEMVRAYTPERVAELSEKLKKLIPLIDDANAHRYQIEFMGDGADSRIHVTHGYDYHDGFSWYGFGIFLASRGYAFSDKIGDHIKQIHPLAIERWSTHCVPLLEKSGIEVSEPEIVIINQVW